MYQLFNTYFEAYKKGKVSRSYFVEQLKSMGKDDNSILVLLDQFEFDAKLLSTFPKQCKKEKQVLKVSIAIFILIASFLILNARFNLTSKTTRMMSVFVLAAPLFTFVKAYTSVHSMKKSSNRIRQKWKSY